ncbi:MAG TPA: type IV secretion system DNA-binding domain-containing protein [Steroidobacteraceae bacterium]|nr:type IV secretion system DNA-binding domain-containing protein [Steroidobacteraceae bacterium]
MLGAATSVTQGSAGLALGYVSVAAPMLFAMARNGASWRRLIAAPVYALPVTLAAGAAVSGAASLGAAFGWSLGGGAMSVAAGAVTSVAVGYIAGRVLAKPTNEAAEHRRGTVVVENEPLGLVRTRQARSAPGRNAGLTLAGVPILEADETKHFKIIGTTGTGKSTAIAEIMTAALARGDRAVIADPDGGYLRRFYRKERGDVILNPFAANSRKWDLFGEIQTPYDIEQLARSLIPDHEGSDRSWRGYARTFFTAVARRAHEAGVKEVSELHRLLVIAEPRELRTLLAGTAAQPFLDEHNTRMFDSIRSVTSSAVTALEYIGEQRQEPLSVREWVRGSGGENSGGGVLFIPYQAGQIAALRSQISAWMRLSIFEAMNQPESAKRLWFVVDELDAVGQIDGLKDALARLRKFGGRCVLGVQSVSQVSSIYNRDAHTIVENCANSLILRSSASEGGGTARFASNLIGDREVLRTTHSRSRRPLELVGVRTTSQQVTVEAAVLPSQIEQLPDLSGYLKLASRPQWLRVRLTPDREATAHQEAGYEL